MYELQQHLQSQREAALRLVFHQNQLLNNLCLRPHVQPLHSVPVYQPPGVTATTAMPAAELSVVHVAVTSKGKVISLFDYHSEPQSLAGETQPAAANTRAIDCHVFSENDMVAMAQWKSTVDTLLAKYGADDALAINRKQMADMVFMPVSGDALFFHKSADGVMFVTCYVGPEERYVETLDLIVRYAQQESLIINIMAQEDRVDALQAAGLSTTPIGIWQRIAPLSEFSMEGSKMRRLRYLVSKYARLGECETMEYIPGSDATVDAEICAVMDRWVALKQANPPFVAQVQRQIRAGEVANDHRFFLTFRDALLENVIVMSRDNLNDGYLMDLEFYGEGLPLGSTEYALAEIIECFRREGRQLLSLGLTMGTGLFEHPNRSQEVHDLFASLKKAEYLDGDANAQYKNKYRPISRSMYIARPQGCGRKKLNDLMLILGAG